MHRVTLFVEDQGLSAFVTALVRRVGREFGIELEVTARSAVGGRPRVLREVRVFVSELQAGSVSTQDIVIVATDANCRGRAEWLDEIHTATEWLDTRFPGVLIPIIADPHVERWMMLDGTAFRSVFGSGCNAPDYKCEKDRYKEMLLHAIESAGIQPALGGMEFADEIVAVMDLERMSTADASLGAAIGELRRRMRALSEGRSD